MGGDRQAMDVSDTHLHALNRDDGSTSNVSP